MDRLAGGEGDRETLVAALRGETEDAERMLGELRAHRLFPGMPFAAVMAQQVEGLLALFDGRAAEAYDALARAFDPADPHYHSVSRWLLAPDLADAAVAAGTVQRARELLDGLPELAARLPSEMMVVAHVYTEAVLAPDDTAEEHYAAALAALPAGWALARARLHLHHGRRLRRQRHNVDARNPLRSARDEFDRIGARPWAEMAREQLRAAGESSGRRHANTSDTVVGPGDADRGAGVAGAEQPGDRPAPVHLAPHRRSPPVPHLSPPGHHQPGQARCRARRAPGRTPGERLVRRRLTHRCLDRHRTWARQSADG